MEQDMPMAQPPLRLLDDAPWTIPGPEDRLAAVVRELAKLAREHLEHQPFANDRRGLRIGLFGGFGQGKTSVLLRAREIIEKETRLSSTLLPRDKRPRFLCFDAAQYLPADLEFELDRVLAAHGVNGGLVSRRVRWGMVAGILSLTAALALAASMITAFNAVGLVDGAAWRAHIDSLLQKPNLGTELALMAATWGLLGAIAGWTLPWLAMPIRHWLRAEERRFNLGAGFSLVLPRPPDVLLVDNLDRASLDQQRAFLRAIYKHSDSLPALCIIAMDESGLRNAPPSPEEPAELLRKAIHAECRLPVWLEQDPPGLVRAIAERCIEDNPYLADLLRDPMILGDMVRVLTLLPGFGPRRVKRFLNDLLLYCRQLELLHPVNRFDFSALVRLLGIYDIAPRLRGESEGLITALEDNSRASLESLADYAFAEDPDRTQTGRLAGLLLKTRAMEPADGLWRDLVGQLEERTKRPTDPGIRRRERHQIGPDAGSEMQELCFNIARGFGAQEWLLWKERRLTDSIREGSGQLALDLAWPAVESALLRSRASEGRKRLYEFWESVAQAENSSDALFRLYRVRLVDEESFIEEAPEDLERLRERIWRLDGADRARLLLWWPTPKPSFTERIATLLRLGADLPLDRQRLRLWLASPPAILISNAMAYRPAMTALFRATGVLDDIWPALRVGDLTDQQVARDLKAHFAHLCRLYEAGVTVQPRALRNRLWDNGWLSRQLDLDQSPCLLDCLAYLLRGEDWSLRAFAAIQPDNDPAGKIKLEDFVAALLGKPDLIETTAQGHWQIGLLLAGIVGSTECLQTWLAGVGTAGDPGFVGLLIDESSDTLWKTATPEDLARLLGRTAEETTDDWRKARVRLSERLPKLLQSRPDYAQCMVALGLEAEVVPG